MPGKTAEDVVSSWSAGHHSDILRFATAGSVDDGKSTLIGRLLYDSKAIFEDQLAAVDSTAPVQLMSPTVRYLTLVSNSGSSSALVT